MSAEIADYHLLEYGCIMQADDEALDHDCKTWWRLDSNKCGRWMIGCKYNRSLFVPIRRIGPRPFNKIEKILATHA